MKIYKCLKCGKIIESLNDSSTDGCCGQGLKLLTANVVEASREKHLPIVEIDGEDVVIKVGEILHPMTTDHFIEKIIIEDKSGFRSFNLTPTDKPEIRAKNIGKIVAVYAYCNLHGLWMTKL